MIDILNKVKALDGSKSVLNIFSDTSDEDDYLINLNAQYLITSLLNNDEQKMLYEYIKEHEPINEMSKVGYVLRNAYSNNNDSGEMEVIELGNS